MNFAPARFRSISQKATNTNIIRRKHTLKKDLKIVLLFTLINKNYFIELTEREKTLFFQKTRLKI